MSVDLPWRTAWVTGASSGIGRELALLLAAQGVHVAVSARSTDKLQALEGSHPNVFAFPLDVTDEAATLSVCAAIMRKFGRIDLAVLNAGYWQPMDVMEFDCDVVRKSFDVNLFGLTHALAGVIPHMIEQRSGHIGLVASVAGYRGLPRSSAYGSSKAAAIHLAESLTPDLAKHNIKVTLVNPGFVKTPMTDNNDFPMPFMISADVAAERMLNGLRKNRLEVAFPWRLVGLLKIARLLPYRIYCALVRTFLTR